MRAIEILSELVMDTLEELSTEKKTFSAAAFRQAFSAREDVLSLIYPACNSPLNGQSEESGSAGDPAGFLLAGQETGKSLIPDLVSDFRTSFIKILDGLGPVIKEDHRKQFNELHKEVGHCESMVELNRIGKQIGLMVTNIIKDTVTHMDYSNYFLVDLSKDLYQVEEKLSSYQQYNRETHKISNEFNDDLISSTVDMNHVFDSGGSEKDIRQLITSKLSTIAKAIELKRQTDEDRLHEADARITELQNNIHSYNQEILQIRERADCLEREVMLDELTQINNRRAFDLQIRENLRRYHRSRNKFSLILMDVDHFKKVNDAYGHKAGDKCLKEIAQLIRSALRKTDFLARYGGEELVAILHGCDAENAENFAEKIRMRIELTRFSYQGITIPITISLGVTEVLPADTDPEIPFIRVDEAMYQAKKAGRNRVCVR